MGSFSLLDWRGESFSSCPFTSIYAFSYSVGFNTRSFRPFSYSESFFSESEQSVSSSVSALFFGKTPLTVTWVVTLIVINSFYRHSGFRFRSHVLKKRLKGILPSLANGNTSFSIRGIAVALGIITALFHSLPTRVFRAATHVMGSFSFDHRFFSQATTTSSMAECKIACCGDNHGSAITSAFPVFSTLLILTSYYYESTKSLIRNIFNSHSFIIP